MEVTREQELPAAMAAAGLEPRRRLRGRAHARPRRPHRRAGPRPRAGADQRDGAAIPRLADGAGDASHPASAAPCRVRSRALRARRRAVRRVSRSRTLSDDGRIVAVDTPGHTPGHISVICVDDSGRHVMLAGDATDSLEQLHARRADAVAPDPKVHIATMERSSLTAHSTRRSTCPPTTPTQRRGSRTRRPPRTPRSPPDQRERTACTQSSSTSPSTIVGLWNRVHL